ncbi:MAG: S8 family serine peptidase, partial [Saprospiraceae bacterium]
MDVVAPGVCIYTTDLQGGAGQTSNDYWSCFSGTSAACPNVAGVMALILSMNPNLNLSQARQILESTTDKLSGYTFALNVTGQPNGSWNNEVGYGRVNAYNAVLRAAGGPILGPDLVCTSNGPYTLQGPLLAGA